MQGVLAISVILILSVIALFTYIIFTILKQKKLSEMKNDFINNMTHEFKTPISTVSLACEALTDKDIMRSQELVENYIHIISEENSRLGSMAEKILQTAILEKGNIKLKSDLIDVHQVIHEVVKNIALQVESRGGKVNTLLDAQSTVIKADRVHLTNVIFNLLDNANKYTTLSPEITVKTLNSDGGIEISVTDNGIGINKANQKKIFDKLFRVYTGNVHNVKGFGLGLSYVKFIVERHGGRVNVVSSPGKGSTFTVFLPYSLNPKALDLEPTPEQKRNTVFPWNQ